jgi:DNA-binding TFAR19-related protein (PDSD5 family)
VGAEESIKSSENHPDKKRQRVILDSIVEDSARKSADKLALINPGGGDRYEGQLLFLEDVPGDVRGHIASILKECSWSPTLGDLWKLRRVRESI